MYTLGKLADISMHLANSMADMRVTEYSVASLCCIWKKEDINGSILRVMMFMSGWINVCGRRTGYC